MTRACRFSAVAYAGNLGFFFDYTKLPPWNGAILAEHSRRKSVHGFGGMAWIFRVLGAT